MKKNKIFLILIFVFVLVLTGCSNTKEKSLVCTKNVTETANVKPTFDYKLYYDGEYVTRTDFIDKVTFTDDKTLEEYKTSYESSLAPYQNIKYYNVSVEKSNKTLIISVKIDYTKVDYKKILEIEGTNDNIFTKKGKVKLTTLKNFYEKVGISCK